MERITDGTWRFLWSNNNGIQYRLFPIAGIHFDDYDSAIEKAKEIYEETKDDPDFKGCTFIARRDDYFPGIWFENGKLIEVEHGIHYRSVWSCEYRPESDELEELLTIKNSIPYVFRFINGEWVLSKIYLGAGSVITYDYENKIFSLTSPEKEDEVIDIDTVNSLLEEDEFWGFISPQWNH